GSWLHSGALIAGTNPKKCSLRNSTGLGNIAHYSSATRAIPERESRAAPFVASGTGPGPMTDVFRHSLVFFVFSLVVMWLSAWFGAAVLRKHRNLAEGMRSDFGTILAATLTLLGLIIGFSFSMAITRYDQRKNYEEAEANTIGTAYARADLL